VANKASACKYLYAKNCLT